MVSEMIPVEEGREKKKEKADIILCTTLISSSQQQWFKGLRPEQPTFGGKLVAENQRLRNSLARERLKKEDLLQAIAEQAKQHADIVTDLRKEAHRLTKENEALRSELARVKSISFRAELTAKKAGEEVQTLREEFNSLTRQNHNLREGYGMIWLGQLAYTACVEISRHVGLEEEAWSASALFDGVRGAGAEEKVSALLKPNFKSAKIPFAALSSRWLPQEELRTRCVGPSFPEAGHQGGSGESYLCGL